MELGEKLLELRRKKGMSQEQVANVLNVSSKFKGEKLFVVIIKYIAPICIVAILISSVLDGLGIFKI